VSSSSFLSYSLCLSSFPATNLVNSWRSGHTQGVNPYHVIYIGYWWLSFFFRYQWYCGYKPFPSSA
jgi:hypothetical protein